MIDRAKKLLWAAISEMTLEDVNTIYEGPDDTFQGKMAKK